MGDQPSKITNFTEFDSITADGKDNYDDPFYHPEETKRNRTGIIIAIVAFVLIFALILFILIWSIILTYTAPSTVESNSIPMKQISK